MTGASGTMSLWIIIVGMAIGSFALRFLFIGLVGSKAMPDWILRHLRYTAVAIIPALVTPLIVWPGSGAEQLDPSRISAAAVTLVAGVLSKNVLLAVLCGAATLYGMLYLLG
ncbi:MAG: AzlD domain-containing protein [Pseudomonadota bacterium]